MKIKTVPYKGSKKRLLESILKISEEIEFDTFFDGFSGTGVVSAYMRSKGYTVAANDKMASCCLFGEVFLNGFDKTIVQAHLDKINKITPTEGWLTQNYSGEASRVIRGTKGKIESRPKGFTKSNTMKIDAARDYVETLPDSLEKNALIFSIILAANKVFNNTSDQKSCFKKWIPAALKDVVFEMPTNIEGPIGKQYNDNILNLNRPKADVVYLDPPYTTGVLYDASYHLNDSIAKWDKPDLDHSYAIPRPKSVAFRKNKQKAGTFYYKKEAKREFEQLLTSFECKRIILSYSDAPRNVLSYEELAEVCNKVGSLKILTKDHKICMQAKSLNKISEELKEFFFIIDIKQEKK
tara:strand:- start:766 stop:1821 length:1056 start_codon:yes stop_codon:yes gene_type:complete